MRRFEYRDKKSSKFWSIDLAGRSFRVTFGKIGSTGQTQIKEFADEAAAQKEHDRLIREKTGKGYTEVAATSTPKAPARAELPPEAQALFAGAPDDTALRDRLQAQAGDRRFRVLFRFWGPEVYRRNPDVFGPFLREYLRTNRLPGAWGQELEGLLIQVEQNNDDELFRLLYPSKV